MNSESAFWIFFGKHLFGIFPKKASRRNLERCANEWWGPSQRGAAPSGFGQGHSVGSPLWGPTCSTYMARWIKIKLGNHFPVMVERSWASFGSFLDLALPLPFGFPINRGGGAASTLNLLLSYKCHAWSGSLFSLTRNSFVEPKGCLGSGRN